ncbi:hypothetical protein QBC40DRAFT_272077, partial [Triangularia verruculosa]
MSLVALLRGFCWHCWAWMDAVLHPLFYMRSLCWEDVFACTSTLEFANFKRPHVNEMHARCGKMPHDIKIYTFYIAIGCLSRGEWTGSQTFYCLLL